MQSLNRVSFATAAAACALAILAVPATAQDEQGAQACTAELAPAEIESGAAAVEVSVQLSQPVGALHGLEAAPGSGLALASPGDVPRTDMAAEEAPQPIAMGATEDAWTIWFNTAEAQPGVYRVVFTGDGGQCEGEVVVN